MLTAGEGVEPPSPGSEPGALPSAPSRKNWSRRMESNQSSIAYHANALPLSYTAKILIGRVGVEPTISRLKVGGLNHLSYRPVRSCETPAEGIEPPIFALTVRCLTAWLHRKKWLRGQASNLPLSRLMRPRSRPCSIPLSEQNYCGDGSRTHIFSFTRRTLFFPIELRRKKNRWTGRDSNSHITVCKTVALPN